MAASVARLTAALSSISLASASSEQRGLRFSAAPSLHTTCNSQRGRLTIRAARVGGVEIPNAKRIETALTYIHGVGLTTARQILLDTGLDNKVTRELSEPELTQLRGEVSKYLIEGDLRRFNIMAIKRLKDIQCYRGRRHIAGLPCRGQSTKCNARTRRGKKITIAGKKKVGK